jgi:acetylornithine deacetylase/succinyl-diaminopimelate desuccinylase-like protein
MKRTRSLDFHRRLCLCPVLAIAAAAGTAVPLAAQTLRQDQAAFREMFAELVNTNTTYSSGSCTVAAEQLAKRLWDAGYSRDEVRVIVPPGHNRDGNLVAELKGTARSRKPILLLSHLDVVEAKRGDWTRDPFTLVEESGYFFGRGVADDKARTAILVDSLIRFKHEGFRPRRTIKLAATCGEEGNGETLNGAEWLARNMPETLTAAFALNEGGGGRLDPAGNRQVLAMQVGEKATRTFDIEATNPGGHSSVPRQDNAIYDLSAALLALRDLQFPVQLNPTTRAFIRQYSTVLPPTFQKAASALLANEGDTAAAEVLSRDPTIAAMIRTTCVATILEAGHAANALPQRAKATVNCRILPTTTTEVVQQTLIEAVANPKIKIAMRSPYRPMAVVAPLDPTVMEPAKGLAAEMFPNVPVISIMLTGATDATMVGLLGIPTYGIPGLFFDSDGGGAHGLDERIQVRSVYDGRDYTYRLIKKYASN